MRHAQQAFGLWKFKETASVLRWNCQGGRSKEPSTMELQRWSTCLELELFCLAYCGLIDDYWWLLMMVDGYWWLLMIIDNSVLMIFLLIDDYWWSLLITLCLFNIAMENGPFIDDVPINTSIYGWDFPVSYVSHNQMVISVNRWKLGNTNLFTKPIGPYYARLSNHIGDLGTFEKTANCQPICPAQSLGGQSIFTWRRFKLRCRCPAGWA